MLGALIDSDERKNNEHEDGEQGIDELVKSDCMKNEYIEQVRDMCRLLYPANTNIDYFPTNFVVQNGVVYYIDFECNDYMEEWDFENWGILYWSKTEEFLKYLAEHS